MRKIKGISYVFEFRLLVVDVVYEHRKRGVGGAAEGLSRVHSLDLCRKKICIID